MWLIKALKGVIVSSVWCTFTWPPVFFPEELGFELEQGEMESYEKMETLCSIPPHMQENIQACQLDMGLYILWSLGSP